MHSLIVSSNIEEYLSKIKKTLYIKSEFFSSLLKKNQKIWSYEACIQLEAESWLFLLDGAVLCHDPHHLPLSPSLTLKLGFCWLSVLLVCFVVFCFRIPLSTCIFCLPVAMSVCFCWPSETLDKLTKAQRS